MATAGESPASKLETVVARIMNHPKRAHIHATSSFSDKAADTIVQSLGSWKFIIVQTVVVAIWITLNLLAVIHKWDPYPFILLNLVFSTQAAYASPIILMAGNRSAARDRKRDDTEAQEVEETFQLNKTQMEILQVIHDVQNSLDAHIRSQSKTHDGEKE